ncbi:MAG TPA: YbaN family protein [Prolixibacteraceae bacterium]|nr:YbaN family protein [Prolixibacteraceae bacterium]
MSRLTKYLFITLGTVSLGLGVLGIFVPGLPTTPFLLLTASLYMRSSKRLYKKLISNKLLGPYLTEFYEKKGMTVKDKIRAISLMWTMIIISTVFFIENIKIDIIIILIGLIGTIVMGFIVKSRQ